jgi:hypothetical protein
MNPNTLETTMTTTEQRSAPPATADEAVRRARALRPQLAALAVETDRTGEDPAEAMRLVAGAGLAVLAVPVGLGGLWEDDWSTLAALAEAWIELSAGDGAVGQIWAAATGQTAAIVLSSPDFPEATRSRIAQELLHDGRPGRRIAVGDRRAGHHDRPPGRRWRRDLRDEVVQHWQRRAGP